MQIVFLNELTSNWSFLRLVQCITLKMSEPSRQFQRRKQFNWNSPEQVNSKNVFIQTACRRTELSPTSDAWFSNVMIFKHETVIVSRWGSFPTFCQFYLDLKFDYHWKRSKKAHLEIVLRLSIRFTLVVRNFDITPNPLVHPANRQANEQQKRPVFGNTFANLQVRIGLLCALLCVTISSKTRVDW